MSGTRRKRPLWGKNIPDLVWIWGGCFLKAGPPWMTDRGDDALKAGCAPRTAFLPMWPVCSPWRRLGGRAGQGRRGSRRRPRVGFLQGGDRITGMLLGELGDAPAKPCLREPGAPPPGRRAGRTHAMPVAPQKEPPRRPGWPWWREGVRMVPGPRGEARGEAQEPAAARSHLGSGRAGRCPRSSTWSPCAPASGPRTACGPPAPAPVGSTAGSRRRVGRGLGLRAPPPGSGLPFL